MKGINALRIGSITTFLSLIFVQASVAQTNPVKIHLEESTEYLGSFGRGLAVTGGWSDIPNALTLTYYKRDFAIGGWSKLAPYSFQGARFFINSDNGYVGIGRTDPQFNLDVYGNSRFTGSLRVENSADITHWITDTDVNGSWDYNMYVYNSNTALNTFSRIAFGTQGTGLGAISMQRTGQLSGDLHLQVRNGGYYITKLFVRSDGNVGIGTTNPQSMLSVKGKVTAQEVQVTLNGWSDFVFFDSYKLRPLSEVETFINANKHLPDVPSAAVVEKEGVNLGEMDAILLRKIEELTLYLIDQNKKNEQLGKTFQKMSEENDLLKKELEVLKLEVNTLKNGK